MINVKGTLAVLTGGGDCPGLNAVLNAVVKSALGCGYQIYGIENGFNGLVRDRMKLLTYADVSGILPRGGTVLGTTLLNLRMKRKTVPSLIRMNGKP